MYQIREAGINDIAALRELVYQVWPQTYTGILSEEKITYMLELMYSETSLAKQMQEGCQFIFIDEDDAPVGYASYQEIEPHVFKLHKLYVLPSQQGKGTGRYLVNHIIDVIKKLGAETLQLQVNRANKARNFYERLGFEIIGSYDFDIGQGFVMDDYVMEKKLK